MTRGEATSLTIHDVAQAAGVSIKTVSRVLRDEPHVAELTRARVQSAAQRLGYVPMASARNLASSVSTIIGLVRKTSQIKAAPRLGHEYLMALQSGVMRACRELGYTLMVVEVSSKGTAAAAELLSLLRSRQIGGCLIPAPTCDLPGLLDVLEREGACYAAISPARLDIAAPWVCVDERSAMHRVVRHLAAAGHRHIGALLGEVGTRGGDERLLGYREAMTDLQLAIDPGWIERADFSFDTGREAAHRMLRRKQRPSAIVASSDDCAAGVIAAAHERGMVLPEDLSVTGFDDIDLARKVWPGLTTVHQPFEEMAALATRQLVARMQPQRRFENLLPTRLTIDADLIVRGSVSAPSASAYSK